MDKNQIKRRLEVFSDKLDTFQMELLNEMITHHEFEVKVRDYSENKIKPFIETHGVEFAHVEYKVK